MLTKSAAQQTGDRTMVADVEILLATYKPNINYFIKLLDSLNRQTHQSILLSVLDDSDDAEIFARIENLIHERITSFAYRIAKNETNLGSTRTFERLTQDAQCKYLAYCDQDDIWEDEKIARLVEQLEESHAVLCYSDLSIIDEKDDLVATSFRKINKRLRHLAGEGLFCQFLRRNSVTGCTMLILAAVAKQAIPFCDEYYIHDHWLALMASSVGRISYLGEPLVRYRIHENNQIGNKMLAGIHDKSSYCQQKLQKEIEKYTYLLESGLFSRENIESIRQMVVWVKIRKRFFEKHNLSNTIKMCRAITVDPQLILFELFLSFAPAAVGRRMIKVMQR
jgi:glycosyltransferase involved in cell wall biosynthesis